MSFRLKVSSRSRKAGRFIGRVRDEIVKAFLQEKEAHGISQEKVAQTLGVNRSQINRILKGEENLTLRTVADLAWALDRDIVFSLVKSEKSLGQNHFPDQARIQIRSTANWPSNATRASGPSELPRIIESAL